MRLFKYTNHFGTNILRDLQLKVTPPNELNDPFEFSPYMAGRVTEAHVHELVRTTPPRELYEEMKRNGVLAMPPFEEFEETVNRMVPMLAKNEVSRFQEGYEKIAASFLETTSKDVGLICFTEQENNMLLWSHYTDGHKGMILEFDTSHDYFKNNSKFIKVRYSETRVSIDPTLPENHPEHSNIHEKILSTKDSVWAYENEWRSLFPLRGGWCHQIKSGDRILFFTDIPPDLIVRVVLGYRCPLELERQVREAKEKRGLNFRLSKAFLHPSEFKVTYCDIQ